MITVERSSLRGDVYFFFCNFISTFFVFEARYLIKWLLLHDCFVFSFSVCYLDIFLKFYITFTISFRSEKNRSNVKTNFIL